MSGDSLERAVWSALTGPQASLATGAGEAARIDSHRGFFAASDKETRSRDCFPDPTARTKRELVASVLEVA